MNWTQMITLAVCAFALSFSAWAQSLSMKFTAPAAVAAAGVSLPAGAYTIRTLNTGSATPTFLVESDAGVSVLLVGQRMDIVPANRPEQSSVLMVKEGEIHRLTGVWLAESGTGYRFTGPAALEQ